MIMKRKRVYEIQKPCTFSWLEKGVIGGMGFPGKKSLLNWLETKNVKLLVTLTTSDEMRIDADKLVDVEFDTLILPIKDCTAPTIDQIQNIYRQSIHIYFKRSGSCCSL